MRRVPIWRKRSKNTRGGEVRRRNTHTHYLNRYHPTMSNIDTLIVSQPPCRDVSPRERDSCRLFENVMHRTRTPIHKTEFIVFQSFTAAVLCARITNLSLHAHCAHAYGSRTRIQFSGNGCARVSMWSCTRAATSSTVVACASTFVSSSCIDL